MGTPSLELTKRVSPQPIHRFSFLFFTSGALSATRSFVLRLPSVIAGTVFGWMVFKWMSYTFGQTAGWIALVLTAFLPPLIGLSSEVRQYAMMICYIAAATYFLE